MRTLFWTLCFCAGYSYFLYPLLLKVILRCRGRVGFSAGLSLHEKPKVTLIVTAYNEEARIAEKIENSLSIDYPRHLLEVLIASDCSSDATDEIARGFCDQGVKVIRSKERLGKENAQLQAINHASGDLIVFSDVATRIPPDAFLKLAAYFESPQVGAVSSEDRFVGREGGGGEGVYVRYEMWLRRMESDLAGLVGLSGSFFAARRSVCLEWDIHSPSDFNTALNCARAGLRAVNAPDVLGYYTDLKDPRKEYQRKVRTVLRGITAVARHPEVLNPLSFGLFSWQLWSHKILRWVTPMFLLVLFPVSMVMAQSGWVYRCILGAQVVLYVLAALGFAMPLLRHFAAVRIAFFFVQVNMAILEAAARFSIGVRMTTWQPSGR